MQFFILPFALTGESSEPNALSAEPRAHTLFSVFLSLLGSVSAQLQCRTLVCPEVTVTPPPRKITDTLGVIFGGKRIAENGQVKSFMRSGRVGVYNDVHLVNSYYGAFPGDCYGYTGGKLDQCDFRFKSDLGYDVKLSRCAQKDYITFC